MTALPLLRHERPKSILGYVEHASVNVAGFLREVDLVARALPKRAFVLNLCSDRYRFAVGLAAALVRRQVTLLPPDHTSAMIARLSKRYDELYCLADKAAADVSLERFSYPETSARLARRENLSDRYASAMTVPKFAADQVAAHVFTSGSTGEPSAHEKTFGSLVSGSCIAGAALAINRFTGGNLLATVPAQHMYGLESSVLLPLQHGVAFDGGRPFYPADILARLSALPRPRILVTTPVHLRVVLADAGALPELDLLICATAPLFPQLASEAEARFGAPLYEIYGCTEAGQLASRRTTNGAAWKLLEGITLRSDTSRFFAAGGPVEQEAELQDLLEIESDDTFLLHGRRTDLINVGGKRTSLAALNFHLNSIPGVHDGVFVMPDHAPDQLTRLVAFVVAPGVSDAELQLGLRNRIDPAFLPRPLYRVAELPRNTTGKLPRSALTRLVAESAEE